MRKKSFTKILTAGDVLDVTIYWEQRQIIRFALNYRARIAGQWETVYRVDNFHGFLHEQKFWRSAEPLPLPGEEMMPINIIIDRYIEEIMQNFQKYKEYFQRSTERK